MRALRNLDDVRLALSEVLSWKDKLESSSWDFHGKRITNASPSKDSNDYVVRSELPEIPEPPIAEPRYYSIIFCSIGDIAIGDKVCAYEVIEREGEGYPVEIAIAAVAITSTVTAVVTLNDVSICNSPITLTNIGPAIFVDFKLPVNRFAYKDRVNINILGGTANKVSITVRVKKS